METSRKSPVNDLADLLLHFLQSQVKPGQHLCVGLSGGLDSVALLDLLDRARAAFPFTLSALHVNHQISPHADAWEAFCQALCAARHISFASARVACRRTGSGLEAAAREARYQAFAGVQADYLVLAHHLDDQAETLLLQLLRGSGVQGAGAMPVRRHAGAGPVLLRPLLGVTRAQLHAYADAQALAWVEDESNQDAQYDRNYLRHQVLPHLAQRFPAYRQTLARSSRHMAEAADLLQDLARIDAQAAIQDGHLRVSTLRSLSAPRGKNLLRYYLQQQGVPAPATTRLEELLRQLLTASPDACVQLPLSGAMIGRYRDQVYVLRQQPAPEADWEITWQGEAELCLPTASRLVARPAQGDGISLDKLAGRPLILRNRRGGERLQLDASRPRRSLKNLLQEAAVPAWRRPYLVLVYCAGDLVCVPGIGISSPWRAQAGEPGLMLAIEDLISPA
jgi:tRNA(Ile)-lysidine synthase